MAKFEKDSGSRGKPLSFDHLKLDKPRTPEEDAALMRRVAERRGEFEASEEKRRVRECLMGLGGCYWQVTLENFVCRSPGHTKVLNAVREYRDTFVERMENHENLVLYGTVGTGKDHLASAVFVHAIRNLGMNGRSVCCQDWFGAVRDAMDDGGDSEESLVAKLSRTEILLLSDPAPAVGNLSQHQVNMLYRVINYRAASGLLTLVTVNVANDEQADRVMGAPTWDRMCHNSWKIQCAWKSHREPAREVRI
jgi:DNA replication protein DnaC